MADAAVMLNKTRDIWRKTGVLVALAMAAGLVAPPWALGSSATVLHDNSCCIEGRAVSSQDFAVLDDYDAEGADDFSMRQSWTITRLTAQGALRSSEVLAPAYTVVPPKVDRVIVRFYAADSSSSRPGPEVARRTGVPANPYSGQLDVDLSANPVVLGRGNYWLSVQSVVEQGQWFWRAVSGLRGRPAVWRNPGGGFARGCRTWDTLDVCLGGDVFDDFGWTLYGYAR